MFLKGFSPTWTILTGYVVNDRMDGTSSSTMGLTSQNIKLKLSNVNFSLVRPGGLYVVEDIETSWMNRGKIYGYDLSAGGMKKQPPGNAVEVFKNLVDVVNRKHFHRPKYSIFDGDDLISAVEFEMDCCSYGKQTT